MGTLLEEDLELGGFLFDTAIGAYLLSPTDGSYELEKLSISYFNVETAKAKLYQDPDAFAPLADQAEPAGGLGASHRPDRRTVPRTAGKNPGVRAGAGLL